MIASSRLLAVAALFAAAGCTALLGLEDLSGPDGVGASSSGGEGGGGTVGGGEGSPGGQGGQDATAGGVGGGGSGGSASCRGALTILADTQELPGRVAVGDVYAYWIVDDGGGGTMLRRVAKVGVGQAMNIDGYTGGTRSDALVAVADRICWAKNSAPVEVACRIGDGAFMQAQLDGGIEEVVDMTIAGARVYVTTYPTAVYSVELSMPMTVTQIDLPIAGGALFSGIDGNGGRVCVAQQEQPAIRCFDPGTNEEDEPPVLGFPASSVPTNLVLGADHIYLTNPTEEAIYGTPYPGVEITVIAGSQIAPGQIALDTTSLYWTANPRRGDGRLLRWPLGGLADSQETVLEGLLDAFGVAVDDSAIYVTDRLAGTVYRCSK